MLALYFACFMLLYILWIQITMDTPHAVSRFTDLTLDLFTSNATSHAEISLLVHSVKNVFHRTPLALYTVVLAWLAWRLWTFTIHPLFYPDRPKIYPYSIPCRFQEMDRKSVQSLTFSRARTLPSICLQC
jgi:hypothetical protein